MADRDAGVFDADALLVGPLRGERSDVADRVDASDAGAHTGIDFDTAGLLVAAEHVGELEARHLADRADDEVGVDDVAVGQLHTGGAVVAEHRLHAHTGAHLDTAVGRPTQHALGDLEAERAGHRLGCRFEHRGGVAVRDRCCSSLHADEAAADDREALRAGGQDVADRKRLIHARDAEHARLIEAGDRHLTRCTAGGDHQGIPGDLGAIRQRGRLGDRVGRRHGDAEAQIDAVLRVRPDRRLDDLVEVGRADDHRLRQRRPIVRRCLLIADQDDLALVTDAAQRQRRGAAGHAAADDQGDRHFVRPRRGRCRRPW